MNTARCTLEALIIIGDARRMDELADRSVQLIVTSPPYWQLKDYGVPGQIGYNETYEEYLGSLAQVWTECHRVLHPGCRLCINIGDQFARAVIYGRYKVIPIRAEIIRACESIGFDYMGAIIWQKQTTMNTTGGASVMGSYPYPRNGIVKIDYEFILLFKKLGTPPRVSKTAKEEARLAHQEWETYFSGHWRFGGERQDKHLAAFPVELPRRLIRMFSFPGETVLDPFLGSGTTAVAALLLGRNAVGYEIDPQCVPVIRDKVGVSGQQQLDLTGHKADFKIIRKETQSEAAPRQAILAAKSIDRVADPKEFQFGSRISATDRAARREDYYRVQAVLGPDRLKLHTGLVVRLLGVRAVPAVARSEEAAIEFLNRVALPQRVALEYDRRKHDETGVLLAYVYLENKAFLNAKMLREGVAAFNGDDTCVRAAYLRNCEQEAIRAKKGLWAQH